MPREIVHWTALTRAEELLARTDQSAAVLACLREERAASFLGALAHDAPYYYKFGGDPFESTAEYLHGADGNDTLLPLKIAAMAIAQGDDAAERRTRWAFLLGMISHAVTDWTFHPWIFYTTGNYNHPERDQRREARRRHRLIETYLDSWFRKDHVFWNGYQISASVKELGKKLNHICTLLDEVLVPESFAYHRAGSDDYANVLAQLRVRSIEGRWRSSLSYLLALQSAFLSPLAGSAAKVLAAGFPDRLAQFEVLFSRGRLEPCERFRLPFQYKNPVSGESDTVSVDELMERAVVECAEIFAALEPVIQGERKDVFSVLQHIPGKSLNFGLMNAPVKKAHIFSDIGIELPGLEIC
jgi:hypothetical protein